MRAVAAVSVLDHPCILFRASHAARTNEHSEKEGKKEEMNEPRQVADILIPSLSLVLGGTGQDSVGISAVGAQGIRRVHGPLDQRASR